MNVDDGRFQVLANDLCIFLVLSIVLLHLFVFLIIQLLFQSLSVCLNHYVGLCGIFCSFCVLI